MAEVMAGGFLLSLLLSVVAFVFTVVWLFIMPFVIANIASRTRQTRDAVRDVAEAVRGLQEEVRIEQAQRRLREREEQP